MSQASNSFQDRSIKWKLGVVLMLFALLGIINFASVRYFKNQQKEDAPMVDAAGRNRMLSQRIAFYAERIVKGQDVHENLKKAIELHNTSLSSLKMGGVAPGIANDKVLPPTADHILPTLLDAEELWKKYRQQAEIVLDSPLFVYPVAQSEVINSTGTADTARQVAQVLNPVVLKALEFIEKQATPMLTKNNELVKRYVADNERKQFRVDIILFALLLINFGLIGLGLFVISKFILHPARIIQQLSQQLALGDLTPKSDYHSQDELGRAVSNIKVLMQNMGTASTFAQNIGQGEFQVKFQAASEEDTLGRALLTMRDKLLAASQEDQKRQWVTQGMAQFNELLRQDQSDLTELSQSVLKSLINYLEANQGAVFIVNDEDTQESHLELLAMYAWGRKKHITKQVQSGENLLGQAWLEQEMLYLLEIPDDYVEISSGIGKTNPRCLLIVPLLLEEKVFGMLEIASLKEYEEYHLDFLRKVAENIASVFASLKVNERTRFLLEQTQQQAEEMRAAEEEMRQNMEELSATQEEMSRKEVEYQRIIEELKSGGGVA